MADKEYIDRDTLIDLLYVIRTNMTSITRYVRHDITKHPSLTVRQFIYRNIENKKLAENAVDNILNYINGDSMRNKCAPVSDVAPVVHAHWCYDSENGVYNCSRCGNAETSDGRYCSYCGAKMDGGKHDV